MKRSINNKTLGKGGRPTKKLSEKRKYRITVKMAPEEYYAMKLKAKNAGVSASEIVRMAIRDCHIRARLTTEQADYIRKLCGMAKSQPAHSQGSSGGCKAALRAMPIPVAVNGKHYRPYQLMMAKIVKGSGVRGIVDYILDKKKQAMLIDCQGVLFNDNASIGRSFITQSRLNPRVDKFIGHISLSFSKQDLPRLTDELMIQISYEYMEKMGIRDTQYIIGRHYDKEHPHVHIAFNRVDNNGRTISDRNDRYRSERICKELTRKYGLYFANGKEQVKMHRLKEPDKTRYEIYQVLKRKVVLCSDWATLLKRLKAEGIDVRFKYKGNTNEVQGIIFTKNGYHFNGSKIDRCFSYSKIEKALNGNSQAKYQRPYEPYHMQISHFENKESEFISGSLGLLDFTSSPDMDSQEEADFRRLMQQKPKKKKTRGFKL